MIFQSSQKKILHAMKTTKKKMWKKLGDQVDADVCGDAYQIKS